MYWSWRSRASLLSTTDCVSKVQRRWPEDIAWHPRGNNILCAYSADGGDSQISVVNLNKSHGVSLKVVTSNTNLLGVLISMIFRSFWFCISWEGSFVSNVINACLTYIQQKNGFSGTGFSFGWQLFTFVYVDREPGLLSWRISLMWRALSTAYPFCTRKIISSSLVGLIMLLYYGTQLTTRSLGSQGHCINIFILLRWWELLGCAKGMLHCLLELTEESLDLIYKQESQSMCIR